MNRPPDAIAFTAASVVSALGRGLEATLEALRQRRSGLRANDFPGMEPAGFIGRVDGIETLALPEPLKDYACRNNRLAFAAVQADGFADAVAAARDRYGAGRIGVLIGTSTSGIEELEQAYRARDAAGRLPRDFKFRETHDLYSPALLLRDALGLSGPAFVISTACSSSANAVVTAAEWLDAGLIDAAVVGGIDSLCLTTLRGFQSLELLSPEPCQPCGADRKGLSIGEAAALLLVERRTSTTAGQIGLLGYGSSNDAHHMSTPHPEGVGARRAMTQALERAGLAPADIDYVNLHGTGTPFNDTVEDIAVHAVLGDRPPCSSTKGWTGHTLGTAGAIEAAIAMLCIREGLVPGCLNLTTIDPQLRCNVVSENHRVPVRRVLSNSFGFGGNNCCLVLGSLD
ncbi:MAG: beta-ketoacyl-[acyl-carrier-protein] synthase family protein [Pseudomonadota bacterium]